MTASTGRTRWGRTILAAGAALASALVVSFGLTSGVLAAQFVPGGVPVELTTSSAAVDGLGGSADTVTLADGTQLPIIALNGETAELTDLCATLAITPPIGPGFVMVARAPARHASDLSLDATSFAGNAHAENIVIGRDASALTRSGLVGPSGGAGLQADVFALTDATASLLGVRADVFALDGLTVSLEEAGTTC